METMAALRDFLRDGIIRNAVNFPSVSAEEFSRLRPFVELGERLGAFLAQMNDSRAQATRRPLLRRAGRRAQRHDRQRRAGGPVQADPVVWRHAGERPERRRRPRHRDHRVAQHAGRATTPSLLSVQAAHERRRTLGRRRGVRAHVSPRLVLVDGIDVEAPLEGTMIVIRNNDQPGVIGEIGTILGRHGVNIANFALGRDGTRTRSASSSSTKRRRFPTPCSRICGRSKAIREARIVRV